MTQCIGKLEELFALHEGIHWFCPRSTVEDADLYLDEDLNGASIPDSQDDTASRKLKVEEAERRRDNALVAFEILAFDGEDAIPFQNRLRKCLQTQLTRCDICVREYHRSRALLKDTLDAAYPADDVAAFMDKYDEMNNLRIVAGLESMSETLMDLPPAERSIAAAGDTGMYALFEALNSVPFLNDETLLRNSFDQPFRLVQSKKKIKLPSFAPGMAAFLFSANQDRSAWAYRNFAQIKRPLLANEFEYSVKPFLQTAMNRVNIVSLELGFLPLFWRALRLIVSKLTKDLVTNHLRALDVNLFMLSLEHFQVDAAHFTDLIACYQILLDVSPSDFWDAMGSASPQSIIETICRSPSLEYLLTTTEEREPLDLERKMLWADSFIKHIKPANLIPPLRTLLDQLLTRFQAPKYSNYARNITWKRGLTCLAEAIDIVNKKVEGGPVYSHLIEAVSKSHMGAILLELEGIENKTEMSFDDTESLGLKIVEAILALDVKNLARDRRFILKTRGLDHELGVSNLAVWTMCMRHINGRSPTLTGAVLSGIKGLVTLDKLATAEIKLAPKQAEVWNDALEKVRTLTTTDLLERLDSFSYEHLVDLYQEPMAAQGLIALLFSGHEQTHQSTLSIIKNLSGEDSRRDSLMHLVKAFQATTLSATAESLGAISDARVYTPCSIMLKLCTDIYDCLCSSQDGVLRLSTRHKSGELLALGEFWQATWTVLETIFETTETWSLNGYDKTGMQDFCRETMDFAENAFDQYAVIANALKEAPDSKRLGNAAERLLQLPKKTFRSITKWLRLRDEYLIDKSVRLTCKILSRLQQANIRVSDEASQYVEDIVTSGEKHAKVKTKLTMNQKAELQRALEQHTGQSLNDIVDRQDSTRRKQSSLQTWATSAPDSRGSTPEASTTLKSGVAKERQRIPVAASTSSDEWRKRIAAKKESEKLAQARAEIKQKEKSRDFVLKRQQAKMEAERVRKAALAKEGGGGSGLNGLGDLGKVHSDAKQSIMVESASESEEEDDELDEDLFGVSSNKQKRRAERLPLLPAGARGPKPEQKAGPTRIQRTARTQKDMRARLSPDLAPLHRIILGWDFFHDGDYPPGANPDSFSEVSDSFRDPITYQTTFEQLLVLEAWQGMVKAREESSSKPYEIKVQNRSNVDSFLEISSIIGHPENRDLQLQEGDIILFSASAKPTEASSSPHCLARIYRIKRQKAHLEIVYQTMPGSTLAPRLTLQAMIYGLKIQSVIPLEREYGALKALIYYDLCTQIIRAKPSARISFSDRQISAIQDVYDVNKAQSQAINAALENDGFSLIQGPPGSGKTKTIVAIVGGLLSQTLGSASKGASRILVPRTSGAQHNSGDTTSKKLLVCAPSNAAVDELVMRLKHGVKTKSGVSHSINVVRIGRSDAINAQVVDVTMDELVAKKLGNGNVDPKLREMNAALYREHEQVSAQLRELYQQRDSGDVKGPDLDKLEATLSSVRRRKNELGVRIDNAKDKERNAGREAELNRKRAQQAVLDEAHVICATLSGSGHDMFQSLNIEFETVVIDEAAQCVEMSSLIPLKYGCVKCIMVGDPKQLPPTVFSKEAAKFQYEQSLFVRMQNNFSNEVHLLDTQYRMHPDISVFPSRTFYDGLLKDGKGMAGLRKQPWHASALLAPYRFFDVKGQHQSAPKGHSLINLAEIDVAMALFERLKTDFSTYDFNGKIGIITPYKSQLRALKDRFAGRYGNAISDIVEFNTTDAFQGRESEIIIFSCVRASPAGGIGFLQDIRRMNVGLTRAKSSLWVLGNSESLARGRYWKKLVDDAQARDCYTTGNIRAMLNNPAKAYPADSANTQSMTDVEPYVGVGKHSNMHMESNGPPSNGTTPMAKFAAEDDRMEGVRYKFEDRISKPQKQTNTDRYLERPLEALKPTSEDVEMGDADVPSVTKSRPTNNIKPRAESSLSSTSVSEAVQSNGPGKTAPAPVAPSVPQVARKKRPVPSPFMPSKRPRPPH